MSTLERLSAIDALSSWDVAFFIIKATSVSHETVAIALASNSGLECVPPMTMITL